MADATCILAPTDYCEFSVEFGAAETSKTIEISPGASADQRKPFIWGGILKIPNWTNAVTLDAAFTMPAGGQTLTLDNTHTALAENGQRRLTGIKVPVPRTVTLTLTLSGVPGAGGGTVVGALWSSIDPSVVNVSGDLVVDSDVNLAEIGGNTVSVGAGAVGTGVQRTTLASDDPAVAHLATLAGAVDGSEIQVDIVSGGGGSTEPQATTSQARVDLPTSAGSPQEIDPSTAKYIVIACDYDFAYCFAANSTDGGNRFTAGTVAYCPAGRWTFPVNDDGLNFYIRNQAASTETNAVSYDLIGGA